MNEDPASLDRLHDILEPHSNVWWPLATGWYWLFAFILLLVTFFMIKLLLQRRQNYYRREALNELARCEALLSDHARRSQVLYSLSGILKRTALTAYPRAEVAALTGPDWFAFLDRTGGTTNFTNSNGAILEQSVYDVSEAAKLDDARLQELFNVVRHWLKYHRADYSSMESI